MKKIFNVFKRLLITSLILFVGFLIFLTGQTIAETIKVRKEIKEFIKYAEYQPDISIPNKIEYYKVPRETYYVEAYKRDPFFNGDITMPGAEGDILVTRQAPIPTYPGLYDFVSFYFGGHAAYVGDEGQLFETYGFVDYDETILGVILNGGNNTHVDTTGNYFLDENYRKESDLDYRTFGSYYRKEWFGLRVKGVTKEEVSKVTDFMKHLADIEAQYNHLFIFNTKDKYYCTDMMSRGYGIITDSNNQSKYNLNMDGVAVTVNDLILSNDTYFSHYVTTDKNDVKKVYYLDD